MTHSALHAACIDLAHHVFGSDATATVQLTSAPTMSAAQPQLSFRMGFRAPGKTAAELLTLIGGDPNSLPLMRAAERCLIRGMNTVPAWGELHLAYVNWITGSLAIAPDPAVLLCDFRCQPPAGYDPDN